MKTKAYWLTIGALAVAAAVLWTYNKAHADGLVTNVYASNSPTDTVVKSTILDNSKYPDIVVKIECEGSDISDMVSTCATLMREQCPDGGTITELGETPVGVLPAQIEITIACRHEASGT